MSGWLFLVVARVFWMVTRFFLVCSLLGCFGKLLG